MSDHYDSPLSTQPGWQGQYSYLGQNDSSVFPFEQSQGGSEPAQPRSITDNGGGQPDAQVKTEEGSPLLQRPSIDSLGIRAGNHPSPIPEHPEAPEEQYTTRTGGPILDESAASTGTSHMSMGSNLLNSVSPVGMGAEHLTRRESQDDSLVTLKEEDEEDMEDDDLIEGDVGHIPQTAAERTAARRKMKRFR